MYFIKHVTSGNVTPTRTNAYEGSFTMPGEDVTIALSGASITELLQVGKYVAYDTSSKPSITISNNLTGTGTTNTTVSPASYTGGWIVLSNNGTTVTIIAAASVASSVKIYSTTGVQNIGTICSSINSAYLNNVYATSVANPTNTSLLRNLGLDIPLAYTGTGSTGPERDYVNLTDGSTATAWATGQGNYTLSHAFRPVITLKSEICVSGGIGTKTDPYTLTL